MDKDMKEMLEVLMNQFGKRFDSVDQTLVGIHQRLSGIEEDQALMKQDIRGIKDEQSLMKQDITGIKQDIIGIKQDVKEIKEDQQLIKRAVLDTNERVMKMETVLENQHNIIELLSARSIQQEAELKRIK